MATKKEVLDAMRQYPDWSSGKIAEALGCGPEYVRATALRNGLNFSSRRSSSAPVYAGISEWFRPLSADEEQEARALWADGFDTRDIAEQLGRRESLIYNVLCSGRIPDPSQVGKEVPPQAETVGAA